MARSPSLKTQSSAFTHFRIAPYRSAPCPSRVGRHHSAKSAEASTRRIDGKPQPALPRRGIERRPAALPAPPTWFAQPDQIFPGDSCREKSTITPGPIAPPAMLLPDPRGTSGVFVAAAHFTIATTSSVVHRHCDRGRHYPADARCLRVDGARELVFAIYPSKPGAASQSESCSPAADSGSSHRIPSRISCRTCPRAPFA